MARAGMYRVKLTKNNCFQEFICVNKGIINTPCNLGVTPYFHAGSIIAESQGIAKIIPCLYYLF